VAARKLEGVVVEADVALAILALSPLRVGGGDPEQRLAVAPAGHVGGLVFELETEKAEQLAVEILRAGKIADAEHQVIGGDEPGHDVSPLSFPRKRESIFQSPACVARWVPAFAGTTASCCGYRPRGRQPPRMPARPEVERGPGR